jgi:hypothetical protein
LIVKRNWSVIVKRNWSVIVKQKLPIKSRFSVTLLKLNDKKRLVLQKNLKGLKRVFRR